MLRTLLIALALAAVLALVLFATGVLEPQGLDDEVEPGPRRPAPRASDGGAGPERPPAPPPAERPLLELDPAAVPPILVLRGGVPPDVPGEPVAPDLRLARATRGLSGAELVDAVGRLAPLRFHEQAALDALRATDVPAFDEDPPLLEEVFDGWRSRGFEIQPMGRAFLVVRLEDPELR